VGRGQRQVILGSEAFIERTARNEAMARAYLTYGYTLGEIGWAVGLHYATISRIISAMEKTSWYKM
jgi:hypothetical protein